MRRKLMIFIIFAIGLGIFSYPIISNMFSTTAHQKVVVDYQAIVEKLPKIEKEDLAKKGKDHNEKLNNEEMNFIDPFDNGSDKSGNKSYYDALNIGEAMGSLKIDKIKVDLPIYHGTSEGALSKGVGHLENTSLPLGNKGEYSVLTAHRGLPSSKLFRNIDKVDLGDKFTVQILDDLMTYKVFEIDIVLPDQTDWLKVEEDKNIVTLLSCEPYMINTDRILVKGELIAKEKVKEEDKTTENPNKKLIILGIIGAIILLIIIIVILLLKRQKKDKVVE